MKVDGEMSVKGTIVHLTDEKPLSSSRLVYLSDMDAEGAAFLEQVWATIETERRRQILSRLAQLAEDNFELNFDSIFRFCLGDEDAEVRCMAIKGLWENEQTSLLMPLIGLLEHDTSERVQAEAASALGKFAMLAELKKLRQCHVSKISRALLAATGDTSKPVEVRRRALEAVAPFSITEVAKAIREAYYSDNFTFKVSAIYAMGKNCSPSWLSILLEELDSPDGELRYEAAGACGELGREEATAQLVRLTDDRDVNVQLAAIRALGKIGGKVAKEHLAQCLGHASEPVRDAARQALDELDLDEDPLGTWRRL